MYKETEVNVEIEIDDVDDHLHHRVDDRAATRRTGNEPRLAIFHDNCRHHRRQHPFPRSHRIEGCWQAVTQRFCRLCMREVIHLIVQQHARSGDHHARTEIGTQRIGR